MVIIATLPRSRLRHNPVAFRVHMMLVTVLVALLIATCYCLIKNDTPLGLFLAVVVRIN